MADMKSTKSVTAPNTPNTPNTSDKLELEYMDTKALLNCSSVLRAGLDKSVQKGHFTLDETEKLLVSWNSLTKSIDVLDKYQTYLISRINDNREKEQTSQRVGTLSESQMESIQQKGVSKRVYQDELEH